MGVGRWLIDSRWRVGVAALAVMLAACGGSAGSTTTGPAAPSGTTVVATTLPAPSTTTAPVPPPTTVAPVRAGGMTLLGSVPGSNGDLAFWGDLAVVTNVPDWERESAEDGFVVVDIADSANPVILGSFQCYGAFQDISVWDGLVIVSQDRIRPNDSCGALSGSPGPVPFAGLRIVSIADPTAPVLLASVPTAVDATDAGVVRGSHTHTIVPDLERDRLLVYAGVYYYPETHPHASIVEVPLDDPASARVIGTFENGTTRPCHDITVFVPGKIASCAAYEAGIILFDLSDPVRPVVISSFVVPAIREHEESHHSTVFATDGTTLVVNSENGGPCLGGTDSTMRSLWFYDISDPSQPEQRGTFQLPRAIADHECYPHQSNIVPTGDRDLLVTGWFGGGVDIVDFSDPTAPREIAFWVSGEADGIHSFVGYAYWYNGRVYATSNSSTASVRGLDIFEVEAGLVPEFPELPNLNPQTQEPPPP